MISPSFSQLALLVSVALASLSALPPSNASTARRSAHDDPHSSQPRSSLRRLQTRGSSADDVVQRIKMGLIADQRAVWEQGTAAEAILELDAADLSVFSRKFSDSSSHPPYLVLSMAYDSISRQAADGRLGMNLGDVVTSANSGSAMDGASNGPSVLLGAELWDHGAGGSDKSESTNPQFWWTAAEKQLNYLLQTAPRGPDGIISHRADGIQFWADGMYMGFPFLAYYGLVTNNQSLLQTAYEQCSLYRSTLQDQNLTSPTLGLWRHIIAYNDTSKAYSPVDPGFWATGNGWATGGMLRVLASISASNYASQMSQQVRDLITWVEEILFAAYRYQDKSTGLFNNYVDHLGQTGGPYFLDSSGSAALAYASFRIASLSPTGAQYAQKAEKLRQTVISNVSPLGKLENPPLDEVNALNWSGDNSGSPESLAFAVLMEAAYRDWKAGNSTDARGVGVAYHGWPTANSTAPGNSTASSGATSTANSSTSASTSASASHSTSTNSPKQSSNANAFSILAPYFSQAPLAVAGSTAAAALHTALARA